MSSGTACTALGTPGVVPRLKGRRFVMVSALLVPYGGWRYSARAGPRSGKQLGSGNHTPGCQAAQKGRGAHRKPALPHARYRIPGNRDLFTFPISSDVPSVLDSADRKPKAVRVGGDDIASDGHCLWSDLLG